MIARTFSVAQVVLNNFKNDNRVLKESQSLIDSGYQVEVFALHEVPLKEREDIAGVSVFRIKLFSRQWPKLKPVQILKYLEYLIRATILVRKFDIVHCNDLNALPIGIFCKCLSMGRIRVVYDAHEYEINDIPNQGVWSIRIRYILERLLIKYADRVITVSDSIAEEYARLYSIRKPSVVLNCPIYTDVIKHNLFREELGIHFDQKIFLYQGRLSRGRGIELLIEVFSRLENTDKVVVFMGYGPMTDEIVEQSKLHKTIYFRKAVNHDVLLDYTSSADYGILFYENNCLNHLYCAPNKMFEYIMAGLPLITSNLLEVKRLVESNNIGIVARENSVEGFNDILFKLEEFDYSTAFKILRELRKLYCWETQSQTLLRIYRGI